MPDKAKRQMPDSEPLVLSKMIDYSEGSVVSKQLTKSKAGNLTLFAFDAGEGLSEHTAPFDAVVLDPPRAGAAEQTERLTRSKVPVVIAVSCAPATLARDARMLINAGYKMGPVTPIDQFIYSPHIEAMTVFSR